jgi:hypothetical protein
VVDFEFEVYMIKGIAVDGRHQPQKNQITAQHLYIPETLGWTLETTRPIPPRLGPHPRPFIMGMAPPWGIYP